MARPIPVLPEVGSTITVPGPILPSCSAASIIATAMRSFTLWPGLKNSSLATTVAPVPSVTRFRRTSGVLPIRSVTEEAIRIVYSPVERTAQAVMLGNSIQPRPGCLIPFFDKFRTLAYNRHSRDTGHHAAAGLPHRVVVSHQHDALQIMRRRCGQPFGNGLPRHAHRRQCRVTVYTATDGRERQLAYATVGRFVQAMTVTLRQLSGFVLVATAPYRADGMKHPACRQRETGRYPHLAYRAKTVLQTGLQHAGAGSSMNGAIHPAAATQTTVGRIDDGVYRQPGDIAAPQFDGDAVLTCQHAWFCPC